jgi:glutathione-independent formaldehyde dehydrogenase
MRPHLGWAKSHSFFTGQTSVLRYNRQMVNATVISLGEAPTGYKDFDKGAARRFVLYPHGVLSKAA